MVIFIKLRGTFVSASVSFIFDILWKIKHIYADNSCHNILLAKICWKRAWKKHFIDHFWQKVALNTCISQLFFDVLPTKQMQWNAYRAPQYPILISYSEGAKYFGGGRCGCYTEFGLNSKYLIAILWISFSVEEFQVFFRSKSTGDWGYRRPFYIEKRLRHPGIPYS